MNLTPVKDVLMDYFGVELPDNVLELIINSNSELKQEIIQGYVYDTYVRELVISEVCRRLDIKVSVPNVFGVVGSHEWPCFGDSDAYKAEFDQQLNEKLKQINSLVV